MESDPYEEISFLTSSPNRIEILRLLADDSGRKTHLQDRSGLSRSTVRRTVDTMEDTNLVEQDGNRVYHITLIGRLLIDLYDTFESSVGQLAAKETFFHELQNENIDVPFSVLKSSELTAATGTDPHVVIDNFRIASELEVDQFVGVLPVVSPIFNQHARAVLEQGADMELVIDPSVLDASQEKYADDFELGLQASNFQLLVHPTPLAIGLAAFDDKHALFGAFNDKGQLNSGLTGDSQVLIDWVEKTYHQYRNEAVPISDYL
jgi:predicted transcriptional regulator